MFFTESALRSRLPRTRLNAFLLHLIFSLVIFAVLVCVIYWGWFPGALLASAGGIEGIKIVTAVDLVLGPTLMLIVYNSRKPIKKILFDVAIIFTIQLSSLFAGIYIVYQERPVAVVYLDGQFNALKLKQFVQAEDKAFMEQQMSMMHPVFFYIEISQDPSEQQEWLQVFQLMQTNIITHTALYRPLPQEELALRQLVKAKLQNHCLQVGVLSLYDKGLACYHPETNQLSDFQTELNPTSLNIKTSL